MTDTQTARIACEILALLRQRGHGKTICPSEVARRLPRETSSEDDWTGWMPAINAVAAQMARAGMVVITQGGRPVNPAAAEGPIRIGMAEGQDTVRSG